MTEFSIQNSTSQVIHDPQMAIFKISDETFGIGISKVKEIVRYPEITTVPNASLYLKGLANLRGNVLPVIDARIRLGLTAEENTENTRVLILNSCNLTIGIIVDKVNGVYDITDANIEAPPEILTSGVDSKFITNIIKQKTDDTMIMELDVDTLCAIKIDDKSGSGNPASATKNDNEVKVLIKEIQLVTCNVAGEEYGFPIETVREILRVGKITHVPEAPYYVVGVFSVRNSLLPIVDIRKLFGLPSLIEEMTQLVEEFEKCTTAWFSDYKMSVKSGSFSKGDIEDLKISFISWTEKFRTSSELIGKSIQEIKNLYKQIEHDINRVSNFQKQNTVEDSVKFFEQEFMHYNKLLSSKFNELLFNYRNEISEDQRILVIEIGGMQTGILVDNMRQVITVPENIIDQPPSILSTEKSECLKGIVKLDGGKKLILLVDENKLIQNDLMKELHNMNSAGETRKESEVSSEIKTEEIQLVTFKLGHEEFALDLANIQEINRLDNITVVPRTPSFIEGVMNLRGKVIPAIDLRKKFNMETVAHNESTRVIIVNISGNLTGLIVDSVSEVVRLSKNQIDLPPEVISSNIDTNFITGIGKLDNNKRILILIDAEKILSAEEKKILEFGIKESSINSAKTSAAEKVNTIPENITENTVAVETSVSSDSAID